MDIRLGLSVYNKAWLIDPATGLQLLSHWENVRSGEEQWDYRKAKGMDDEGGQPPLSSFQIQEKFFASSGVMVAPEHRSDMYEFKGFDGAEIVVIPVKGALMKSDYCGWFGTQAMRELFNLASRTDSVHTIILDIDSPGGTVDGTQSFATAIKASTKRTIALVDGLMCSAAYWIGSSADEVYASNDTDIIGSVGTMISWYNRDKYMAEMGLVLREYYATESVDKNKSFRDADKGDGKLLVQEMLDPMNSVFLKAVTANRGSKLNIAKENVLSGKTYLGAPAVEAGLVDGIKSFEEVIKSAQSGNNNKNPFMSTENHVFQNVLAAANAESIPTAEGGFLMTEEQLTAVDAALAEGVDAAAKLADATAAVDTANASVTAAEAKVTELQGKLDTAMAHGQKFDEAAATFFGRSAAPKESESSAHEQKDTTANLSFNKLADQGL